MLLFGTSSAFAQAPPAYPGATSVFTGTIQGGTGLPRNAWNVSGPGVNVNSFDANTQGWSVSNRSSQLTITIPANAPLGGPYTVAYATQSRYVGGNTDDYVDSGPTTQFQVVNPPPTLPATGSPAFAWQGSVGGVNTGNGNKTTTVPITGWTQRGGMAVSCALYHNSQGSVYGPWGNKWVPSYFTYLSLDGSGNPTLHWDNGLSYAFLKNGSAYTPPYGILDTLTSSGGTFTLTTPGGVVYTFGYAPGNAYLSKITDLDGNALTINHNADTTLSTVVDTAGRTLTYTYVGGHLSAISDPLGRS